MKNIDYPFQKFGVSIISKLSLHNNFVECEEYIETPFSQSTTILPPNLNFDNYKQVVIRCYLEKPEEIKLLQSSIQPQAVCVEILEEYANNKWSEINKILYKTLTCSPRESQYLYLVEK